MARPSKYNEALGKRILALYASGSTIAEVVSQKGMPDRTTVYRWRTNYPEFGKAYDLAVEAHVEALIDKGMDIVMNTEPKAAKMAKVQSDFLCWLASKLNRAKYGDKLDITQTVIMDLSPALLEATKRMQSIGVGTVIDVPSKQLESDENINKVT